MKLGNGGSRWKRGEKWKNLIHIYNNENAGWKMELRNDEMLRWKRGENETIL